MGFDHMALVRRNTPYITRGGPFQGLDLRFLLMIAEPIPASRETPEWFMPMSEIKHRMRMRPETREADIIRIYKHLVELGYLKVHNGSGRGRKANTYILTDTIMKGAAPPPERKAKAVDPGHVCDCEGKDHTNDAACRQYRSYQKKTGKGTKSRRGKGTVPQSPTPSAPAPAPEPATEAELQAKAEAQAEREKRQAERQREREEQKAEARRIEDARHEDLCLYDLSEGHMTLEDCKRMYPSQYNRDGSMK